MKPSETHCPLSESELLLADLMYVLQDGRIEGLRIRQGPLFDKAPRIIEKYRFGIEYLKDPNITPDAYLRKREVLALFAFMLDALDEVEISIEVRGRLPVAVELETEFETEYGRSEFVDLTGDMG
jgi:hypothetical protein